MFSFGTFSLPEHLANLKFWVADKEKTGYNPVQTSWGLASEKREFSTNMHPT